MADRRISAKPFTRDYSAQPEAKKVFGSENKINLCVEATRSLPQGKVDGKHSYSKQGVRDSFASIALPKFIAAMHSKPPSM